MLGSHCSVRPTLDTALVLPGSGRYLDVPWVRVSSCIRVAVRARATGFGLHWTCSARKSRAFRHTAWTPELDPSGGERGKTNDPSHTEVARGSSEADEILAKGSGKGRQIV